MLDRWFLAHPRSVGEGYFEHQRMALGFSLRLLAAGTACLIHALVPALFRSTGSRTVAQLHDRMVSNRRLTPDAEDATINAASRNRI